MAVNFLFFSPRTACLNSTEMLDGSKNASSKKFQENYNSPLRKKAANHGRLDAR